MSSTLSDIVIRLNTDHGWTDDDIASFMGVSERSVRLWRRGQSDSTATRRRRLALKLRELDDSKEPHQVEALIRRAGELLGIEQSDPRDPTPVLLAIEAKAKEREMLLKATDDANGLLGKFISRLNTALGSPHGAFDDPEQLLETAVHRLKDNAGQSCEKELDRVKTSFQMFLVDLGQLIGMPDDAEVATGPVFDAVKKMRQDNKRFSQLLIEVNEAREQLAEELSLPQGSWTWKFIIDTVKTLRERAIHQPSPGLAMKYEQLKAELQTKHKYWLEASRAADHWCKMYNSVKPAHEAQMQTIRELQDKLTALQASNDEFYELNRNQEATIAYYQEREEGASDNPVVDDGEPDLVVRIEHVFYQEVE